MTTLIHAASRITLVFLYLASPGFAQAPAPKPARPATLDDLYSKLNVVDTDISTTGRYLAVIVRRDKDDVLLMLDLVTGERKALHRVGWEEAGKGLLLRMLSVQWKSDDTMLLRLSIYPEDPLHFFTVSSAKISKLGHRMFAVTREGKAVALLGDNRNAALEGAFDLGDIRSLLYNDPKHILMELDGFNGRSLFKVNVETGRGEQIERPLESVRGWWLDLDGNPVVRVSVANGTIRLSRKDEENKWRVYYKMRVRDLKERPEYEPVGPSNQPDKYYVRAQPPGHDRLGLYLYDLKKEEFGQPIIEHPTYDIEWAKISLDGTRVLSYCYVAHIRICEFTDSKINAHMKGLRKYFEDSANLHVFDASDDGRFLLLYVEGPRDPPAFYYYQTEKKDIQMLGSSRKALEDVAKPTSTAITWKARDGKEIHGYLTLPVTAPATGATKLPLIVHPHGGPEARDQIEFNPWVQFFAARGYAVFQPNFRGSSGFGRQFAEIGYGEWGGKMQNDITDGIKMLTDSGTVDPSRICIVGASYGGYAALAGAALTPDLYKCSVSVAGISDLDDMIGWTKRTYGGDTPIYDYVLKVMGDPDKDAERIRATSPALHADKIKIPVMLVHGTDDAIVPIAQSRTMERALKRASKSVEFIELEKEGHGAWEPYNEIRVLSAIDGFLWKHLGPGHGNPKPPSSRTPSK